MIEMLIVASLYIPVHSSMSASPLHVAAIDTNTMAVTRSWEFPSSYTGHRSVCFLPGASPSMVFAAWTGGERYDPAADQFGVSSGYGYPLLDLTYGSPITERFDLWKAGIMRVNSVTNTSGGSIDDDRVRVRVVRWKINDVQRYNIGFAGQVVEPRVVLDKILDSGVSTWLTETDFLNENCFDLDWEHFHDEVVDLTDDTVGGRPIVKAEYLVILGYGYTSWDSTKDTNRWVTASQQTITRYFGGERVDASGLAISTNAATGAAMFSWRIDEPNSNLGIFRAGTTYTAFRILASNDTASVKNSGILRLPHREPPGVYRWHSPPDWTNITAWGISVFNSKYRATNDVWSVVQ